MNINNSGFLSRAAGNQTTTAYSSSNPDFTSRYVCAVTTLLFSLAVLFTIRKDRTPKTSFKAYIAHLCVVNLVYLVSDFTKIANSLVTFRDAPPHAFCNAMRYLAYITPGLLNNAHFLIALNRVWAITWPLSYRHSNRSYTTRNAVIICGIMWLYVHVWTVPFVVLTMVTKLRNPTEISHCSVMLSWSPTWAIIQTFILYDLPIAATCLFYPLILFKTVTHHLRPKPRTVVRPVAPSTAVQSSRTETIELTNGGTGKKARSLHQVASSSGNHALPTDDLPLNTTTRLASWRAARQNVRHGQFLTLSLLTLNVTVCLLPGQIFHTMPHFGVRPPKISQLNDRLYLLSPIFDCLLFLLTVKSLRDTLKTFITERSHAAR